MDRGRAAGEKRKESVTHSEMLTAGEQQGSYVKERGRTKEE